MSAILPNDMLFHIVSHLDASGTHSKSVRRALVRLAQAHSTFKKPALATLWRSLPDAKALEHLLCVLGIAQEHLQGTRQDSARLRLCGTLETHESGWARFQEYSVLVREITLDPFIPIRYSFGFAFPAEDREDTFWGQLTTTLGVTSVLPRLKVVNLRSFDTIRGSTLDMGTLCFLDPSICEFNVYVPGVSPEGRGSFARAFAICFSSVQNLEVISLDTDVEVLNIRSLPQLHPRLRRLTLEHLVEPNDLACLASLHDLGYLSLTLASHTEANLPIKLLGLRSLAVNSYGRDAISAFITDMDAPQLQSFSMSQYHGNPEEIHQELENVLRVLVSKCLSLTTFSWRSDQWMGRGEKSRVKALADLVAPLLSVHTIRNFSAYLRGHMLSYTPSHIRAFAEAWPDLEVFDLRTADVEDGRDDEDPHADLESLVSFARHCPRLERLYTPRVKFDRDAAAAFVRPPAPHWLHSLDVADVVLCGDSEQDRDAAAGGDLFGSLMHEIFPAAKIEF